MITNALLHYTILKHIIDEGFAPDLETLSVLLKADPVEVQQQLYALQDYHGIVLHPNNSKIWVIHPFSLAPTNFFVRSAKGEWWGNCAWCSLGVAALLKEDLTISTNLGAHDEQVIIHIINGEVREKNLLVHFPIPMKNAWDNVIYTCSNMLVFKDEEQIDQWTKRHHIPKGDIQPITNVWEFSKKWYGNHLNPDWEKWTMQEAKDIFLKFSLTGRIWDIETSASRF
jgi:Alkylmercury lyase